MERSNFNAGRNHVHRALAPQAESPPRLSRTAHFSLAAPEGALSEPRAADGHSSTARLHVETTNSPRAGPTSRSFLSLLPPSPAGRRGVARKRNGAKLAQHTCVLVSHGVSDDPAEDGPAGHADGDSAGAGEGRRCGARDKDNGHRESGAGRDMLATGVGRAGKDGPQITLFPSYLV